VGPGGLRWLLPGQQRLLSLSLSSVSPRLARFASVYLSLSLTFLAHRAPASASHRLLLKQATQQPRQGPGPSSIHHQPPAHRPTPQAETGGNGGAAAPHLGEARGPGCVRSRPGRMGKEAGDERQRPPDGAGGDGAGAEGGGRRRCGGGVVRLQCVAALVLGAAVLLSALFWLPPLAGRGRRAGEDGPDPGAAFRGECSSWPALRDPALVLGLGYWHCPASGGPLFRFPSARSRCTDGAGRTCCR
jgi:hypothetical protein